MAYGWRITDKEFKSYIPDELLNLLDDEEKAFIYAYRKYKKEGQGFFNLELQVRNNRLINLLPQPMIKPESELTKLNIKAE